MDSILEGVRVQPKSVYVQYSAKNLTSGKGSPGAALAEERRPNVELYEERWGQGLDIWTGKPLEGGALADWKRQQKRRNQLE